MINNNIMILEIEKENAKQQLKNQINSLRNTLNSLESKIENEEKLYGSEGLQGNAINVDVYLAKLVAYERSIEFFKSHLNKEK